MPLAKTRKRITSAKEKKVEENHRSTPVALQLPELLLRVFTFVANPPSSDSRSRNQNLASLARVSTAWKKAAYAFLYGNIEILWRFTRAKSFLRSLNDNPSLKESITSFVVTSLDPDALNEEVKKILMSGNEFKQVMLEYGFTEAEIRKDRTSLLASVGDIPRLTIRREEMLEDHPDRRWANDTIDGGGVGIFVDGVVKEYGRDPLGYHALRGMFLTLPRLQHLSVQGFSKFFGAYAMLGLPYENLLQKMRSLKVKYSSLELSRFALTKTSNLTTLFIDNPFNLGIIDNIHVPNLQHLSVTLLSSGYNPPSNGNAQLLVKVAANSLETLSIFLTPTHPGYDDIETTTKQLNDMIQPLPKLSHLNLQFATCMCCQRPNEWPPSLLNSFVQSASELKYFFISGFNTEEITLHLPSSLLSIHAQLYAPSPSNQVTSLLKATNQLPHLNRVRINYHELNMPHKTKNQHLNALPAWKKVAEQRGFELGVSIESEPMVVSAQDLVDHWECCR